MSLHHECFQIGKAEYLHIETLETRLFPNWKPLLIHCVKSVRIQSYSGPNSVQMRENANQNNSEYGQLSLSDYTVMYLSRPARRYLLKVNNINTRARCKTCSKLLTKTSGQRHWLRSGAFIVKFEHISYLVSILLTLNK